jgi:hypothetical protein
MRQGLVVSLLAGSICALLALASDRPQADRPRKDGLAKPVPMEADGKPLVRDGGALFPFVGDFDGDGRQDLLLGTAEDGRLLVYRNVGTKASPRLSPPQWFDDTVPTGRIPAG